jgi:LysR family hca operon transcriptional activator
VWWLPEALRILRDDLPHIEVTLGIAGTCESTSSRASRRAFLRREEVPGLTFKHLTKEPLVVVLSRDHRLAACEAIRPQDIARETFISPTKSAPALKAVIDHYAARSGITLTPDHEAANLSMAISLVVSTGGISLLPLCAVNLLPPSVVSRPLRGEVPTIDLVIGYSKANTSPLLKRFLSKVDELVTRVSENQRRSR